MKTIKVMSIVGICIAVVGFACIMGFQYSDPLASTGWGYIVDWYLIAFAIVGIVQTKKSLK